MSYDNTHVIKDATGVITDYVFLDGTDTEHYPIPNRNVYARAVSFSVSGGIKMNYPVVFDDLTTSDERTLIPIDRKDVPRRSSASSPIGSSSNNQKPGRDPRTAAMTDSAQTRKFEISYPDVTAGLTSIEIALLRELDSFAGGALGADAVRTFRPSSMTYDYVATDSPSSPIR